ncbi:MAG: hypothetical protein WCS73_00225 [Lentisphaeria bacterium]
MATSTFRNKNDVRPKKDGAAKRRHCLVQHRRLVGLGVPQEEVDAMQPDKIRELLKEPSKTIKKYAPAEAEK